MKKLCIGIILINMLLSTISSLPATRQPTPTNNILWEKNFGGTGSDVGYSIIQATDGGYVLVGTTTSTNVGDTDIIIIKTDHNGNEQWNTTFGGPNEDYAYAVIETIDQNYAIIGSTTSYGNVNGDVLFLKINNNGETLFFKTYDLSGYDDGRSLQQTYDRGFIVTGYSTGTNDAFLLKLDANGNRKWNKFYGSTDLDIGYDVKQTSDNGYIIVGELFSPIRLGEIWFLKTDEQGSVQISKTYGNDNYDIGRSIQITQDGGYAIAGTTKINNYYKGIFIKIERNGEKQFEKIFGEDEINSEFYNIKQTVEGDFLLIGVKGSNTTGLNQFWIVKTDILGSEEYSMVFGGEMSDDYGFDIIQTLDGYCAIGTTFSTGLAGDIWLIKIDSPIKPLFLGPATLRTGQVGVYSSTFIHPQKHHLWYLWSFGSDHIEIGPVASGKLAQMIYTWQTGGIYSVTLQVRDNSFYSSLSEPLSVLVNDPPTTPEKPNGPTQGIVGQIYTYSTKSNDPNGDAVAYQWDWGNQIGDWTSEIASGQVIQTTNLWPTEGIYSVHVRSKDHYGAISEWSPVQIVYVTNSNPPVQKLKIKEINGGINTVSVIIENSGSDAVYNINWSIDVTGGIFKNIASSKSESIPSLDPYSEIIVKTDPQIRGLGKIDISINVDTLSKKAVGLVLGKYVIILGVV
ncbi:MAG: hypothetical protein QXL17_04430 [Candidatus Thermoplasmatota archaeon]